MHQQENCCFLALQVASLKDTIAKKDGEIERLLKNDVHGEKRGTGSFRYESSHPSRVSRGGTTPK